MIKYINIKNVCLLLGVLFSFFIYFNSFYVVTSTILFIIFSLHILEITEKKKKILKDTLNKKIKEHEEKIEEFRKENLKLKSEVESIKLRLNIVTGMNQR